MKKITSIISAAACLTALTAASLPANAADSEKIYGTMNIPYADFYAAEIGNAYEVDAVSSATKHCMCCNGADNDPAYSYVLQGYTQKDECQEVEKDTAFCIYFLCADLYSRYGAFCAESPEWQGRIFP